ncbi:SET and MYND domain-containing protein 4 [Eufriesea mexicana]|uniref:Protein-lysine N-methyltransferase SMYD4 n=1 Tax=Eufriesea mexicana TaxID=516756 RepID=A0A310SKE9_9HYME|nr:SET and MYND domain-containing protein 4 [Eufriesea mexicana]
MDIERAMKIDTSSFHSMDLKTMKTELMTLFGNACTAGEKVSQALHERSPKLHKEIRLDYDPNTGRHFFKAVTSILTGDVILIEKALVSQLVTHKSRNACHHCTKYCEALIPCEYCPLLTYCSEECRKEAFNEYHQFECGLHDLSVIDQCAIKLLVKLTKNACYVKNAVKYCEELKNISETSTRELWNMEKLIVDNFMSILDLSTSMENVMAYPMRKHRISVALAMLLRKQIPNYIQDNLVDVLGLVNLICRASYIADTYHFQDDISCIKREHIMAENIFRLLSFTTHSCCANTVHTIEKDNVIVLRAAKDIKQDENITFNFLTTRSCYKGFLERDVLWKQRTGRACECEVCCLKYDFDSKIKKKLDIPEEVRKHLQENPTNVEYLWELLKIINNHISEPCIEAEVIKYAISDAYRGIEEPVSILNLLA